MPAAMPGNFVFFLKSLFFARFFCYNLSMQNRKTKIVCSIGPASNSDEIVSELALAGMNVARLNFSHGDHESHRLSIERVRRVSDKLRIPIGILLDTKGPEIRSGTVENGGTVTINKGETVIVTTDDCFTIAAEGQTPARLSISWKDAPEKLHGGHHILIADGLLDLEVLEVVQGGIHCHARNTATIGSKKNVNLLGVHARLPIMSEQDKKDIAFGVQMDVDFIAASFVSFPHEITEIRTYLESLNSSIRIIAKIENQEGLNNIREIAKLSDGVMVARGDLGVQLPAEEIPLAQKYIITACRKAGKPVITATQMLESMIVNPRPTRAELTDVANAILDGTDAIMLSGETANGAYPVEAVKMMGKIACTIERSNEFRELMKKHHNECFIWSHSPKEDLGIIMSRSGAEMASAVKAKVIVTSTLTGNTARILSVFRPDIPVLAITPDKRAERIMQLYWGVLPYLSPRVIETQSMVENAIKIVMASGIAGISDKIMFVAGLPLNSPHMVNTLRVIMLGTILARAVAGGSTNPDIVRARGRIIRAKSPQEARDKLKSVEGGILVCRKFTEEYVPLLDNVYGIICEGVSEVSEKTLREASPDLVWLTRTWKATEVFEDGLMVTIDAKQLLVYEGTMI
jgi:pyruvate kinase